MRFRDSSVGNRSRFLNVVVQVEDGDDRTSDGLYSRESGGIAAQRMIQFWYLSCRRGSVDSIEWLELIERNTVVVCRGIVGDLRIDARSLILECRALLLFCLASDIAHTQISPCFIFEFIIDKKFKASTYRRCLEE